MPANTPNGLPYPVGTDRVMDGDDAIKNLATAVDPFAGDTGWVAVSAFLNGWANFGGGYSPVAYRRFGGVVYLRGLMALGNPNLAAFILPAGFRPSARNIWVVHANINSGPASTGTAHTHLLSNTAGRADVLTTGDVLITQAPGGWVAGSGLSLANVSFIAEA